MIKRTIYISNPCHLNYSIGQLELQFKEENSLVKKIPIEDIGLLILDNSQVTITQVHLAGLLENNVAIVSCDATHHPVGMFLNLDGNSLQTQKHQLQIEASVPLKKQLWQQTVGVKISNQGHFFKSIGKPSKYFQELTVSVRSGDSENNEAKAAVYYWRHLFPDFLEFKRERYGPPPNNLLNYGYAIVRAMTARALVGSGLIPSLGIFHRNQYNSYCLADDMMEPYRIYVDALVFQMVRNNGKFLELTPETKRQFLELPARDVLIDGKKSPMMNAITRTTASLVKCFEGKERKLLFPQFQ
jgi:CRISP-associated protein Cas1